MIHVVLFQPEIPQNTGNVGRMCAFSGARLHLIHPLGFEITDKHLRRAGMDYWHSLDVHHHDDWSSFMNSGAGPKRLWLLTTHAAQPLWQARFCDEDGLVFGNEGAGAPKWLHQQVGEDHRLRIPSFGNHDLRSLNLASSAGIATYEALRQTNSADTAV